MTKFFEKARIIILVIIMLTASTFAVIQLMKIQIVDGASLLNQSVVNTAGTQEIAAPRGEIIDSKGAALVQNKVGFNVIIEAAFFPTDVQAQNEIILNTAKILKQNNFAWVENIPISAQAPYTFTEGKDDQIAKMKTNLRLNTYATPQNCMDKLIEQYKISDKYTPEEIRTIAGIRYEMLATQFSVSIRYTFAKEVSAECISKIKEHSYMLQGVDVLQEPVRVYPLGTIFPHGLGTTGKIDADEYADLKAKGYKYNDIVGKSGIEKAMEDELRGKNGTRDIVLSPQNQVVSIKETNPAVPGNTVQLTIDKDFQGKVQDILSTTITQLQQNVQVTGKGKDACAGSIVVLDVKTGAVKAMATFPSYDINEYKTNFTEISKRTPSPLFNRAIDGLYRPGSTFKTVTATAALAEGAINKNTTFTCQKEYDYYGTLMHCTGYHGTISVETALQMSCNIFFYNVAQHISNAKLVDYEKQFGLGTPLNFELGGNTGYLASPESFKNFKITWNAGEMLQAAIGQSQIGVSPLQMAVQAMTLANNGVRYRPYVVDSVLSYDRKEVISKTAPVIENTIKDPTGTAFDIVKQGMILASDNTKDSPFRATDKLKDSLNTLPYKVAIKTGTPQRGLLPTDTDSCAIGYYPADNPEIAFSVFIEKGEYSKYMIRKVIDAYYGTDNVVQDSQIGVVK